jgi:hypothetical protein
MQQINPDEQIVIWSMWTGLTPSAATHMDYSSFDHFGNSGGSIGHFTPRDETYLIGVRFGWFAADPSDFVIYNYSTLEFMAAQALYLADETPN